MAKTSRSAGNERYETVSLFDKKSAAELLSGLRLAVSLSLQDRRKLGVSLEEDEGNALRLRREEKKSERTEAAEFEVHDAKSAGGSVADSCAICSVRFDTVEEWRQHLRLDWHLYNVKRRAKGMTALTEDGFEAIEEAQGDDDVSSVSGSSSEDSDAEDAVRSSPARTIKKDELASRKLREQPVVFFRNARNNVLMIHRALLQSNQGTEQLEADVIANAEKLGQRLNFGMILVSGGHFAAAIYEGNQMVAHKTFHSYTVRAKQGGSQGAADARSGTSQPKSAGASLRRYNAQTFKLHVDKLVTGWADHWKKCDRIFYRVPARNQGVLFSGSPGFPLNRDDPRLSVVPISVGRPTLNEVKRAHHALTTIRYYETAPAFLTELANAAGKREGKDAQPSSLPRTEPFQKPDSREVGRKTETGVDAEEDPEVAAVIERLDREFLADFGGKKDEEQAKKTKKKKKQKEADVPTAKEDLAPPADPNPVPKGPARDFMKFLSRAVKANDLEALRNPGDVPDELVEFLKQTQPASGGSGESTPGGGTAPFLGEHQERIVNLPVEDGTTYLLHLAAAIETEGTKDGATVIEALLEMGADPCVKDGRGRVPYLVATDKACRNAFRKFMGVHPDRYDWTAARVPSALTDELAKQQTAKKAERRKALKEVRKDKEKAGRAEAEAKRQEEEERRRFLALSEREKRALAAERRILASNQQGRGKAPVLARCHHCGLDISGKVPFVAFELNFCATDCVRQFRALQPRPS